VARGPELPRASQAISAATEFWYGVRNLPALQSVGGIQNPSLVQEDLKTIKFKSDNPANKHCSAEYSVTGKTRPHRTVVCL